MTDEDRLFMIPYNIVCRKCRKRTRETGGWLCEVCHAQAVREANDPLRGHCPRPPRRSNEPRYIRWVEADLDDVEESTIDYDLELAAITQN